MTPASFYELCCTDPRPQKVAQIKNLLRGEGHFLDLLFFTVEINTALRVLVLLRLQIGQFVDDQQSIKSRFQIIEQKRGKRHEVFVNTSIREIFQEYLAVYPNIARDLEHFLFFNTKANDFTEPIGRGQAWKFITAICMRVGLRGNFGTHSLRKTWGYHAQAQPRQYCLHQTIFLGITDDELQAVVERLNL